LAASKSVLGTDLLVSAVTSGVGALAISVLEDTLLNSSHPNIRAKAIQLLFRWDPAESLCRLLDLLFSSNPVEQALALYYANSFPFVEVEPHLLRFVAETSDPLLLARVIPILRANPSQEIAFKLYKTYRTLRETHREMLKGMIIAVVLSLAKRNEISVSPQEFLDQLKQAAINEEKLLVQKSTEVSTEAEAEKTVSETAPLEAEVTENNEKATAVEPEKLRIEDLPNLDSKKKIQLFSQMSQLDYETFRAQVPGLLQSLDGKVLASLIRLVGRFGKPSEAKLLKPFLDNPDQNLVCAAIDALSNLDSEYLAVYLPQLMQNSKGKIRLHATQAFVTLDRDQAKSMINEMLRSPNYKQRSLAIPIAMQVDFSMVRNPLLKALETETSVDIIQKIGVVLSANPDREILRTVYRLWKHASAETDSYFKEIVQLVAQNLSVVLGKTTSPTDLLAAEEKSFVAVRPKLPEQPRGITLPIKEKEKIELVEDQKHNFLVKVVVVLVALNWILLVVYIYMNSRGS